MRYYDYSVKDVLTKYFGTDPLSAMRKTRKSVMGSEDRKDIVPLSWQYADERTVDLFLEHRFLVDTIIEDDYIAYIYHQGTKQCALLMFMLFEDNAPFSIDPGYAQKLIREWENAGYCTKLASQCVCVENYQHNKNFHLVQYSARNLAGSIYELADVNGSPILVFETHTCWPAYYEKIVDVAGSYNKREYECLFEPTVSITAGSEKSKTTIASGIDAMMDFFHKNAPVRICFKEYSQTGIYSRCLLVDDRELNIWVNTRNLITKVSIADRVSGHLIEAQINKPPVSLADQVPTLLGVRPLTVTQMHGYALQLSYSNGSIRNYYLKMFEDLQIPSNVTIDGYDFTENTLNSAAIKNNGIVFSNGYVISSHLLYHHSYCQLQCNATDHERYVVGDSVFLSQYTLPLTEFKSHFSFRHYWGNPTECYGPAEALLDQSGKRITDISFYSILDKLYEKSVWRVCVEPTGRYGFLRADGTWLAPPVYNSASDFKGRCAKVTRVVNGEDRQFLITEDGHELTFPHNIDTDHFDGDLCPFNAASEPINAPAPGYYWEQDYDGIKAGKWGYIDTKGNIVVQPEYTYVIGFWNGDGERCVVAKLVDDKLLWGAIDQSGKEVIPCVYDSLYTRWGDAFAFRREDNELYGVMDLDGNVIVEPQFEFFEEYDSIHGLLTVGEHEDALGVFSIDEGKMIIPAEYDSIDYGKHIIGCEIPYTAKERYFDYDGKELDFSAYDSVFENNELLCVRKGKKFGYIHPDGTVVVPCILSSAGSAVNDALTLYRKGYIVTGENKQYGLTTVDGVEVLPQEYSEIITHDAFIIASKRNNTNWCIKDTLFTYNGTVILDGPYRKMLYDRHEQIFTVETPYGTKRFSVERQHQ